MNAVDVLERLKVLGVAVTPRPNGNLWLEPASVIPSGLLELVKAHKPEIMAHLGGKDQTPKLKYPDDSVASDKELAEIEATVREHGICTLYCYVLKDYVAFVKDESYLKDVLPDFIPYLSSELRLFGGTDAPSVAKLRLIHEAKKQGARIVDNEAV